MPPSSASRLVLPEPLGPRSTVTGAGLDGEADALHRRELVGPPLVEDPADVASSMRS